VNVDDPVCCGCHEEEAYHAGRAEGRSDAGMSDDPAFSLHRHECRDCRDRWWHDAGDEGCVGVKERTCPIHEERDYR
jgi:hypothetical protein